LGLGSCIGICLYDPISKVSGMAHIMLPSSQAIKNNSNEAKFQDAQKT
jgi:chemotaxis protein CheD